MVFGLTISNLSTLNMSNKNYSINVASLPTDIMAIKLMFFTNPHDYPSGVSDGQIIPQCVL